MKFITTEQFNEQPKKIRDIFLKWWSPEVGDLYVDKSCNDEDVLVFEEFQECDDLCAYGRDFFSFKNDCIPLLTGESLRKFIEDRTKGVIISMEYDYSNGYKISVSSSATKYDLEYTRWNLGFDLLQSYWKMACYISDCIDEEGRFKNPVTYFNLNMFGEKIKCDCVKYLSVSFESVGKSFISTYWDDDSKIIIKEAKSNK